MTADPERPTHDLRQLVTEAEQLRAALTLFVGHGTAARVTLPRSLHDAAAALLLLPDELRQAAKRSEDHEAFHDGVRRAATDRAPWTS